jgi:hypothetical protein
MADDSSYCRLVHDVNCHCGANWDIMGHGWNQVNIRNHNSFSKFRRAFANKNWKSIHATQVQTHPTTETPLRLTAWPNKYFLLHYVGSFGRTGKNLTMDLCYSICTSKRSKQPATWTPTNIGIYGRSYITSVKKYMRIPCRDRYYIHDV